jgi:hypothetical protein
VRFHDAYSTLFQAGRTAFLEAPDRQPVLKPACVSGHTARRTRSIRESYNRIVTVKEELHVLIERLADEQAQGLLEDLRAADVDGPPLNEEALASLDLGLADIASNRVISLDDFEREHPLPEWQKAELQRCKSNLQEKPETGTDWESIKCAVRVVKDS